MIRVVHRLLLLFVGLLFVACQTNQLIVDKIGERDANEIIVFLSSKGIEAQKILAPASTIGAAQTINQYSISVSSDQSVEAMSLLNQAGLPRKQGTTLLELFAKSGLMSSTMEETIRYQAGMAEQLQNTIRKIDGILDADVQISYPSLTTPQAPGTPAPKITAAVYIKHQGILEDPNSHLEIKIKRLLAGSVNGLDYDNVSVISDKARFADITLTATGEKIGMSHLQTYVSMWGLIMTQSSIGRFRFLCFCFIFLMLTLMTLLGWLLYKFYPEIRSSFGKKKASSGTE